MSYFNTKFSKSALKDIPSFPDQHFFKILKSEHIFSIINKAT
jgi:hypothetical protein